jgi:hypothetical protein
VIVPRRNIETWLEYLGGTAVDENTTYRKLKREGCGSSSLAAQSVSPAAARQEAIGSVKAW